VEYEWSNRPECGIFPPHFRLWIYGFFAVRWYRDVLTAGTGCSPPGLVRRVLLLPLM